MQLNEVFHSHLKRVKRTTKRNINKVSVESSHGTSSCSLRDNHPNTRPFFFVSVSNKEHFDCKWIGCRNGYLIIGKVALNGSKKSYNSDLLAAMLFFCLLAQYFSSLCSGGTNCFRDFLIIGCGLSSSSENEWLEGSKSSCPAKMSLTMNLYIYIYTFLLLVLFIYFFWVTFTKHLKYISSVWYTNL